MEDMVCMKGWIEQEDDRGDKRHIPVKVFAPRRLIWPNLEDPEIPIRVMSSDKEDGQPDETRATLTWLHQ